MHDIFFTQSGKTAGHSFQNIDPWKTQYEALNFFPSINESDIYAIMILKSNVSNVFVIR